MYLIQYWLRLPIWWLLSLWNRLMGIFANKVSIEWFTNIYWVLPKLIIYHVITLNRVLCLCLEFYRYIWRSFYPLNNINCMYPLESLYSEVIWVWIWSNLSNQPCTRPLSIKPRHSCFQERKFIWNVLICPYSKHITKPFIWMDSNIKIFIIWPLHIYHSHFHIYVIIKIISMIVHHSMYILIKFGLMYNISVVNFKFNHINLVRNPIFLYLGSLKTLPQNINLTDLFTTSTPSTWYLNNQYEVGGNPSPGVFPYSPMLFEIYGYFISTHPWSSLSTPDLFSVDLGTIPYFFNYYLCIIIFSFLIYASYKTQPHE